MLEEHLNMLVAAIDSPIVSNEDRRDLFRLMLEEARRSHLTKKYGTFSKVLRYFHERKPALYCDCVNAWLLAHPNDDVQTLLRQLDDPIVSDNSVTYSLIRVFEPVITFDPDRDLLIAFSLAVPMVEALRRKSADSGLHIMDMEIAWRPRT